MASSAPLIMRLVASSVCVSHRAGRIIRDVMKKGDLGIVTKGKNDYQTEADRSGQRCIMASLHQMFPKVSIFGEEEEDGTEQVDPDYIEKSMSQDVLALADKCPEELKNVKDEEITIWVDPLDGTAEYTQGLLDHVTVLIGICVGSKAVAGVIYQPYYKFQDFQEDVSLSKGRAIWGVVGLGAYGFEPAVPPEGNVVTTTRSHSNRTVVDAVDACNPTEILRAGGAGHKVLLVLEGKATAYVFASPGCKKWDTAAPEAVLHAAGGRLTDIHGNDIPYHSTVQRRNTSGVLATPKGVQHSGYVEKIPSHVKEALPFQV